MGKMDELLVWVLVWGTVDTIDQMEEDEVTPEPAR
jgi:hypothetical protein